MSERNLLSPSNGQSLLMNWSMIKSAFCGQLKLKWWFWLLEQQWCPWHLLSIVELVFYKRELCLVSFICSVWLHEEGTCASDKTTKLSSWIHGQLVDCFPVCYVSAFSSIKNANSPSRHRKERQGIFRFFSFLSVVLFSSFRCFVLNISACDESSYVVSVWRWPNMRYVIF